jgi:ELWxxDGT repeat protein
MITDVGTTADLHYPGTLWTNRVGDALFFGAAIAGSGYELWKTDGSAAGTHLVRDVNVGEGDSLPVPLAAVDGTLFFSANDGVNGRELWKTTPPVATSPKRADYKNAPKFCEAERAYLGEQRFRDKYATGKNGSNAHGKCVSRNG